jgi:hypothetical protein
MGLLGLHSSDHDIYATHGSLEGGRMRAGVYIVRDNSNDPPLSPQEAGAGGETRWGSVRNTTDGPVGRTGPKRDPKAFGVHGLLYKDRHNEIWRYDLEI